MTERRTSPWTHSRTSFRERLIGTIDPPPPDRMGHSEPPGSKLPPVRSDRPPDRRGRAQQWFPPGDSPGTDFDASRVDEDDRMPHNFHIRDNPSDQSLLHNTTGNRFLLRLRQNKEKQLQKTTSGYWRVHLVVGSQRSRGPWSFSRRLSFRSLTRYRTQPTEECENAYF
jgi:hypothetical protein